MSGTTMVVLIVLISVGSGVIYDMYKKHLEFKSRTLKNSKEVKEFKRSKRTCCRSDKRTSRIKRTCTNARSHCHWL